jgi:hypothetical protein
MKLNETALEELKKIEHPLVVVSIVGLYRTGKSYLMNRLAGLKKGFELGSTVRAKTNGIWVWCVKHPTKPSHRLLLMDTEGLADPGKGDARNDSMLFLLAALLSSMLINNSRGTIDQNALDSMHFVTKIAELFKITSKSETAEEDDALLGGLFPKFVWAVRDFTLELKDKDGSAITPDEYLESALGLKKGASESATT